MMSFKQDVKDALMTGVSYMMPIVLAGGILIGLANLIGGTDVGALEPYSNFASTIYQVGQVAFGMMVPILGAYTAYSIADKPAIASGLVSGLLAKEFGAGFLGALVGGLMAGFLVRELKKIPLPASLRSVLPILIIPLVSVVVIGLVMTYVVCQPLATLSTALSTWLNSIGTTSAILLGIITGSMYAFDMGGPLNKASYAFAIACAEAGNWVPMGAAFIACMTPQFGIALAMLLQRKKFTDDELSNIPGLLIGTLCCITEFAIPFAAKDPIRTIPALMAGSSVGSALSYMFGLTVPVLQGGIFVYVPLCNEPMLWLLCLVIGAVVTALCLLLLRKAPVPEEKVVESNA